MQKQHIILVRKKWGFYKSITYSDCAWYDTKTLYSMNDVFCDTWIVGSLIAMQKSINSAMQRIE